MRVDRSGVKGFSNATSASDNETSIQRTDGKVKLTAGKEEPVLISQDQDSLKIQINDSNVLTLSPEESKNLEILPGQGKVTIDSNVTIPIKGVILKTEEAPISRIDTPVSSGRREETSLTSSVTQKRLTSELPNNQSVADIPSEQVSGDTPASFRIEAPVLQSNPTDMQVKPETLSNEPPPDAVASEITATEQSASFIRSFIGNPSVSLADQQTIQTLLASAESPERFNEIVNEAGGRKIGELFQNNEMKLAWDRLVGAFGRLDLAENRQEAKKTRELLLGDPDSLEKYLTSPDQSLILRGSLQGNDIDLSPLDRRATICLVLENAVRTQEGRPLLHSNQLREKSLDILLDSTIPKEDRMVLLENLRAETGLSEFQMREIVSRPLTGFFETVAMDLREMRDSKKEKFETQIQVAINTFGPESVAVEIGYAERDEFLQSVEPEIDQFEILKTTASEIFSGPADPLVQIDNFIGRLLADFTPPPQIVPSLQTIEKGATVIENGNLQSSLLKVAVPELKSFIQQGILFLDNMKQAGTVVKQTRQIDIDGFESFEFLQRLVDGHFGRQIREFFQSFITLETSPFREVEKRVSDWRMKYEKTANLKDRSAILETGRKLMQGFAEGILGRPVHEFGRNLNELRLDTRCAEVIESLQTGNDLLVAFRNGHFVQILAAVSQRSPNNPGLLRVLQQALHLTNTGSNFFRGLSNREWEKPIAQALKKDPRSKELREVYSILSDAYSLFVPLQSIDYLTPFLQYQKQLGNLKDETIRNEMIQRYEAEASKLV